MFEYTITCSDPNITEVIYIYTEKCTEVTMPVDTEITHIEYHYPQL